MKVQSSQQYFLLLLLFFYKTLCFVRKRFLVIFKFSKLSGLSALRISVGNSYCLPHLKSKSLFSTTLFNVFLLVFVWTIDSLQFVLVVTALGMC